MSKQTASLVHQQKQSLKPQVSGILQRQCACGNHTVAGNECEECSKNGLTLQRTSLSPHEREKEGQEAPPIVHEVLRSPGQPLDSATRSFFEPRFGYDFSQVRVHTDSKAAESARAVNALAYTVSQHIVFDSGQYAPKTLTGQKLLAHELTHIIQQKDVKTPFQAWQNRIAVDADTQSNYEQWATAAQQTIHVNPTRVKVAGSLAPSPLVQRQASLAAAAAEEAAIRRLWECGLGALTGMIFNLGIQAGSYGLRKGTWRVWEMTIDTCSLFLSEVLGCLGGVSAAFLGNLIEKTIGEKLFAIVGTKLGQILIWLVSRGYHSIPKFLLHRLLELGCISKEQAAVIDSGITAPIESLSDKSTAPIESLLSDKGIQELYESYIPNYPRD